MTTVQTNVVQINSRKAAAVVVPTDAGPAGTSADYTVLTNEIVRLNKDILTNGYEMGVRLAEVADKRLYAFGGYSSFSDYLGGLSISSRWALTLIKIARECSREDFAKIGASKLALMLQAPPEERAELKDKARNGASWSELESQVRVKNSARRAKGELKNGGDHRTEEAKQLAEAKKTAKKESKRIVLQVREGLYAHDLIDRESNEKASLASLETHPAYCTLEFENGTSQVLYVYVDKETGTLKVKSNFKKADK